MNLIQKLHALMVSPNIRTWHYEEKKEKPFTCWLGDKTESFDTLDAMIDAAYKEIDPLLLPLPESLEPQYDPTFGDDRLCDCKHTYYRHFDTYEDMSPRGCKYCGSIGGMNQAQNRLNKEI